MAHPQADAAAPPALATDAESTLARMRFSTRLALGATALTLIFILAVGGLSYSVTREQLIRNQDMALENQAALYAQQIGNTLRSIVNTLETLTENALILNALMDSLTRQTALVPFLRDFSRIDNIPVTLLMTDFEGQPIAGNGQLLLETHDWRSQVLKTGKPYAAIGTDAGGDFLFVVEPIFYSRTLSPEGALLCKVALAHAQAALPGLSEGRTTLQFTYSQPSAAPSSHSQDPNYRAQVERLSVPAVLQPLQLAVEVAMHSDALNASLNRLILIYAAVGIGLVLVVFALARVGAHYLTRPLRELEVVARSVIASGSLDHRFASHGVFEIEQLGRAFNQMLEQLDDAQRQLHRQAEIEAERNRALAAANAALEQEIGERQRVEEALQKTLLCQDAILNNIPDLAWLKDQESRFIAANEPFGRACGLEPKDLVGKSDLDIWPHALARGYVEDDRQVMSTRRPKQVEERLVDSCGNESWVETIKTPILGQQGEVLGTAGIARDITQRKLAEEALRKNEERMTQALRAARAGAWEWDAAANRTIWSDDNYRVMGLTPGSVEERYENWLRCVHPDDRAEAERQVAQAMARGDDLNIEFRVVWPDGDIHWINDLGKMRFDPAGQPVGMYGIQMDITERKQAEAVLAKTVEELRVAELRQRELLAVTRREQGRLRALLAAMSVGILFEDNQQCVEYLNPAFLKMWAIDEALDLVGQPMQEILEHSTHRFARPDHASRYVLQVLDTHEISERCEIDLYDGRILTQMSYPVMDNEDRLLGRLWLYEDITHERQTAQQLLYLAERDPLTGLCNRHSFQKNLEQKIAAALRTGDRFAVIYFDLDEFKAINDTFGHRAGDMVLVRTASEITTHMRATEMFARLGGDEFAILSTFGTSYEPGALPARIVETVSTIPFRFRGTNLRLTVSVGIALFPEHGDNLEDLVAHADMAMYQAKSQGKNTWALYDPNRDSTEAMVQRLNWNSRIAQALEGERFELYFQGVYRTADRTLSHLEVLIRMQNLDDPEHPILPGQFIPLAEKSGQVLDIDRWVLKRSIALLGQYANLPPLAVNLSGRTFDDPALPQFIRRLLAEHGVEPQRLFIELTETAAVSDVQDAQRFIEAIQQLGCEVCLDDFGSGFSTFTYLKYLNVKVLKIDGLFVRDLPNHYDNQVFIRAMVEVAHGLRKVTVAEFVEDAATLDMLQSLGVDLAQGYHLDRPNAEHPALAA